MRRWPLLICATIACEGDLAASNSTFESSHFDDVIVPEVPSDAGSPFSLPAADAQSPPDAAPLLDSNTKVTFDGNSLAAGAGGSMPLSAWVASLPAFRASGARVHSCAISAQSLRMMNGFDGGSAADVDGAWEQWTTNILVIWEATNSIGYYGRSVAEGVQDTIEYIAARKALHPWRVVLLTTLPRAQGARDALLAEWNALARDHYRGWGADALVDVRAPGSLFAFDGTRPEGFVATQQYWNETKAWVHLNDAGYGIVATMVVAELLKLKL